MARISKHPEERRKDLIDAAEFLFMTKGYEQTAISDIVKRVNVAQGTFYYHFKSKIEILEQVAKKSIVSLVRDVQMTVQKTDVSPVTKLNEFLQTFVRFGTSDKELAGFLHKESNLIIHNKLSKTTMAQVVPLLTKIIREGKSEGFFTVTHCVETAKFLFLAMTEMFHDPEVMRDSRHIQRALNAFEHCVGRVLGMEDGSIRMIS